ARSTPACCEPWPGNRKATVMRSRSNGRLASRQSTSNPAATSALFGHASAKLRPRCASGPDRVGCRYNAMHCNPRPRKSTVNPQNQDVFDAALALPEAERIQLVERLLETLPPAQADPAEEDFLA